MESSQLRIMSIWKRSRPAKSELPAAWKFSMRRVEEKTTLNSSVIRSRRFIRHGPSAFSKPSPVATTSRFSRVSWRIGLPICWIISIMVPAVMVRGSFGSYSCRLVSSSSTSAPLRNSANSAETDWVSAPFSSLADPTLPGS